MIENPINLAGNYTIFTSIFPDLFSENMSDVSEESNERFHRDIVVMENVTKRDRTVLGWAIMYETKKILKHALLITHFKKHEFYPHILNK